LAVLSPFNDLGLQTFASFAMLFGGLMLGLIAMMPGNPLDYRGFQRPSGQNDFISRM
jgi:hypothetical protein